MFKIDEVIDKQFVVRYKIGQGSFGSIYMAYDRVNKQKVALKVESKSASFPLVIYEANVTMMMHDVKPNISQSNGFSHIYNYGDHKN